jgi:hypothetical protein
MSTGDEKYPQTASLSQSHTSFIADMYDSIEYLTMPVHHTIKAALNSMQLLHLHPVQYEYTTNGYITHVPGHSTITVPPSSPILSKI